MLWKVQKYIYPPKALVNTYTKLRLASVKISTRQNRAEQYKTGVGLASAAKAAKENFVAAYHPQKTNQPMMGLRFKADSTDPSDLVTLWL